jgi:hypothetical protein
MSHTIYTANGKISHIHRRMCYWDYTEWISRSFVSKAKEGRHIIIRSPNLLLLHPLFFQKLCLEKTNSKGCILLIYFWCTSIFKEANFHGYHLFRVPRLVPLMEQELLTLLEYLSSPPVFSWIRVTRSLVLYVCFVDYCLSICTFSFRHCV